MRKRLNPVLIGLNGRKGSGKNTAAHVIAKWGASRGLVTTERAFADTMKLSAARSLGMATNMNDAVVICDELKNIGVIDISIPSLSIQRSISGREYLKWYGTEGHRDVFGADFWLDVLLPYDDWADSFYNNEEQESADIAVITDLRFPNEAKRVHELGGEVWEIERGLPSDGHPSEMPLPRDLVDLTIANTVSLEAFEVEVNSWMTANFHMLFVEGPEIPYE
jgi:hypothetical protein